LKKRRQSRKGEKKGAGRGNAVASEYCLKRMRTTRQPKRIGWFTANFRNRENNTDLFKVIVIRRKKS